MRHSQHQLGSPYRASALLAAVMAALVIAFASFASFLPPTSAQQQPPRQSQKKPEPTPSAEQDTVVKINTNLVQVDAVVKDETGRIVTDLKAEDFEIVENKRAHPVGYCSYIPFVTDRPAPTAAAYDGRLAKSELGRAIVFLVSNPILDLGVSVSRGTNIISRSYSTVSRTALDANTVSRFLNKFIETQMGPRDLVSILNAERDLGVLSHFSNNRELLLAASEEIRHQAEKAPHTTLMITNDGLTGKPLARQNVSTLDMLGDAIAQTRDLPGRKVIVLVSRGLLFSPYANGSDEVREHIYKLTAQANQARIAIYALNPRGVGGVLQQPSLLALTEETGGKTIDNTNDLSIGFSEILKENQGYYLLGYDPGEDKAAALHKIKVRVKHPGWQVQSRAVAYSTSSASAGETSIAANTANNASATPEPVNLAVALNTPFAVREVGLELTPLFLSPDGKQASILSFLNIDPAGLTTETQADGSNSFKLELGIQITGPDGKLVKQEAKGYSFTVAAADLDKVKQRGLPYTFTLAAPQPGYYQVNTAVRDVRSGHVGNASRIVKVANLARQSFAVSSLALSAAAEKRAPSASDTTPNAGPPFARQRYPRSETLMYQCYVYYARPGGDRSSRLQVQANLKRGTDIIASSTPRTLTQPHGPVLVVAEEMPLRQINPGVYTLELTIEDLLRKDAKLTASAPLEVR